MFFAEYFVEMKLAPTANVPSPQEGLAFTERFVVPTLEAFERLCADGIIVAGGPVVASMSFAFIARADSPRQLEEIVAALPLWPRAVTTVTPLARFSDRAETVRRRVAKLRASLDDASAPTERTAPAAPAAGRV